MEGLPVSGYTRRRVSEEAKNQQGVSASVPRELVRAAHRTRGRLRAMAGASSLAKWVPAGVLFLTPWAISYRFGLVSERLVVLMGLVVIAAGAWVFARGVRRGPGLIEAALRLDQTHGWRGRLAAALDYSGEFYPAGSRIDSEAPDRGYMNLTIEGTRDLGPVELKRAAPLFVPRGSGYGIAMIGCFGLLFVIPDAPAPLPPPATSQAKSEETQIWLTQDDAELLERAATELKESAQSEEAKDAAARFNEIVLLAASGEIDQAEAFRLAAELEADLRAAGEEANEWVEGLQERGAALEKRGVTRDIGRKLQERKVTEAEEALRKLAERLASDAAPLSEKELEELRRSLEEARGPIETRKNENAAKEQAAAEEEQRLRAKQKRLLQKKEQGKASAADQKELTETERRLEKLDRQKKRTESAQKSLSELDQQLAEAARQLQEERKKSGEFLDKAADTMQEGNQRQLSDDEKKELIKQLEALKERLRRQNEEGNQAERLREFLERARGQKGSAKPGGQKPDGDGKPQPGQARLSPGGQPVPVPGEGPGQGKGKGEGEGEGDSPGTGKEPGKAHDPNLSGDESRLADAGTVDTTAVAQDSGQGQSASETILGVAEEGFASSAYDKLYREYQTVAEEVMEKDEVPVGRRAHVLRYFELIRPRGAPARGQGEQ